jgi:hypothetical protein
LKNGMISQTIRLAEVAHGRSGDKGNHANVAILAYTPEGYRWLDVELTGERVASYFEGLGVTRVVRYQAQKLLAFNFILENALGGGASRSLRTDTQGKALAIALLEMKLPRPEGWAAMLRERKE